MTLKPDAALVLANAPICLGDETACRRVLKDAGVRPDLPLLDLRIAANNIRVAAAIARSHGARFVRDQSGELQSLALGAAMGAVAFLVGYGTALANGIAP